MTIADFFMLVKEADLGPFDRLRVPVAKADPTPKGVEDMPEKAATPKS